MALVSFMSALTSFGAYRYRTSTAAPLRPTTKGIYDIKTYEWMNPECHSVTQDEEIGLDGGRLQ